MDISRLNAVMETLRRQLSETERRTHDPVGGTSSGQSRSAGTGTRPNLAQLRQRVQDRIKNLDPADPQRSSRSRRIFVESVLAWEFGEHLLADPRFEDLVEQVQLAMSNHADLDQQLAVLLASTPAGRLR